MLARAAAREDGHADAAGRAHGVVVVVVVVVGGGGPGECWPTSIVTVEPFVAWELPAGFCGLDDVLLARVGLRVLLVDLEALRPRASLTACCEV